jgi:type 1 glutamine amidotransferase
MIAGGAMTVGFGRKQSIDESPLLPMLFWSKMYGKGRVFYSTLGHTEKAWSDPDIRKMYFEAVKWVLGMTDGSTASHPRPASDAGTMQQHYVTTDLPTGEHEWLCLI